MNVTTDENTDMLAGTSRSFEMCSRHTSSVSASGTKYRISARTPMYDEVICVYDSPCRHS
jgi:hypothetical protein